MTPTVHPLHYNRALGIDLRANRVELAYVSARWGRLHSVETMTFYGHVDDPGALRRLHSLLQEKGWEDLPCLIALHGESTVLRSIAAETNDPQVLQQMVQHELEKFSGLQSQEMISGCTYTPSADGFSRAILAVTRSEVAEEAARKAHELNQRLTGLMPGAVALFNTWSQLVPVTDQRCLLIDVGQQLTEIVVCTQDDLLFARSFNARLCDTAPNDEERITWSTSLLTCLDIYQGESPVGEVAPEAVYLAGGCANDELHDWIAEKLDLPVIRIAHLDTDPGLEPARAAPIATGLALGGVRQAAVELSLLPRTLKDKLCLQWQLQYWGLICGILLATLLAIYGLMHWSQAMKSEALETRKDQMRQVERETRELSELIAKNAALQHEIAPLRVAVHNGEIVRAFMDELAASKHADDWITLVADAQSYQDPPPFITPAQARGKTLRNGLELQQFIVEGYTPVEDLSTVNRMIEALREQDNILEVDLLGDERLRLDAERDARWLPFNARLFAIEISVKRS